MAEAESLAGIDPEKAGKIRIMLADDHPLMRQALRTVLERQDDFEIVTEVSDGEAAVKLACELVPDVVIMDISMPKINGLEATKQIKANCPAIAVLVLTVHDDNEHILSLLQAGAGGYLTKGVYGPEVVHSIRALVSGEMVLCPSVARQVLKYASQRVKKPLTLDTGDKLTTREAEILKLAAIGMSNKDIASRLGLSLRTVKGYLADIFLKLHVASRTEAVVISIEKGIISLDELE